MRESLFSILGNLDGMSFLDLFSGSGCVGIEAASRGADPVHVVEKDRGKKTVIQKNLSIVEGSQIKLFMVDVKRFIPTAKQEYDIVYADPPFNMEGKVSLARLVESNHLVKGNGLFIIHYPVEEKDNWPEHIGELTCCDQRKYGRSQLIFYRRISLATEEKE
jgi:16S rRNA (guanine(966)-N(2))-methyltransferase RsmD